MKPRRAPDVDPRREAQFQAELFERARAWVPSWSLADDEPDFGRALLQIAARFSSEVTQRLDQAGEKMRRGFLDWLAIQGEAARPARVPVVFKLTDAAREGVPAAARTQMQAEAKGFSVVFETESSVRIVPGILDCVIGVESSSDAFFVSPEGIGKLEAVDPVPTRWELKSFAAAGAKNLQLDPEQGLAERMLLEAGGREYRVVKAEKGIVTIEPGLDVGLEPQTVVKLSTFAPFDDVARNWQEHALYLGHLEVLNIETEATLAVFGGDALGPDVTWQYWGKLEGGDEDDWQQLTREDEQKTPGAVLLKKSKGLVEPRKVNEINSRWIRAYRKTVPPTDEPFRADELKLGINSGSCNARTPCPPEVESISPVKEGMANTTPLVLESLFYPLGKQPRQFDAFYLGSVEAFSKQKAKVHLCFEMTDPPFSSFSVVRTGSFKDRVLAGVGADRALHLFRLDASAGTLTRLFDRDPLQPPQQGAVAQGGPAKTVLLDRQPRWRLPVWEEPEDPQHPGIRGFFVAASAGDAVWAWREVAAEQSQSGWVSFGRVKPDDAPSTEPMAGLVYLHHVAAPMLFALHEGKLFSHPAAAGGLWTAVPTEKADGTTVEMKSIVPIFQELGNDTLSSSTAEGMLGVASDNTVYTVTNAGVCTPVPVLADIDLEVRPVAVRRAVGGPLVVALVETTLRELVTYHSVHGTSAYSFGAGARVLGFEAVVCSPDVWFLASVRVDGGSSSLASWVPHSAAGADVEMFQATLPSNIGRPGGSPTHIGKRVVIPGTRGDALLVEFDLANRFVGSARIHPGIVVPAPAPQVFRTEFVVRIIAGAAVERTLIDDARVRAGEVFYPIDKPFPAGSSEPLFGYRNPATRLGRILLPDRLEFEAGDHDARKDAWVRVGTAYYRIADLDPSADPWVATLAASPFGVGGATSYSLPLFLGGRSVQYMQLDPTGNGKWNAAVLQRVPLVFPDKEPRVQVAKEFSTDPSNHPIHVVLAAEFDPLPGADVKFILDAAVGTWSQLIGDATSNPELSWEYWNGKGWWKLKVDLDETLNLKSTGALEFEVPDDLVSSDWAGKTNFWIRARLIGGDYGRETVTVKTSPPNAQGETKQTVERTSEGIRPPAVRKLHLSYALCEGVLPKYLLTQDNGSFRDQSDANSTKGAVVEAFVPLEHLLRQLSAPTPAAGATAECPPECGCGSKAAHVAFTKANTKTDDAATDENAEEVDPPPPPASRSLFLGLTRPVSGVPVNVLLLVDKEQPHEDFAPMRIEALVANRFVPLVATDRTRAIGESGLLELTFAQEPTPRTLFGKERTWLRLTPGPRGDAKNWKPALRGAYLNAVWASSAETLTRELLGSSDGRPRLTVTLARPPVLSRTLVLRVKEPLGDEELAELVRVDKTRVIADRDLPGHWVRWEQVVDPDDEPADARVYALDEASGEIRFGDGKHGRIPPIGTDSIVAFEYRRTESGAEGDVPGNHVDARATLNLVSPVEGVEAVLAADPSAGGAPTEDAERVVRFAGSRLRHRGRSVTRRDLEDLALQSSPDIVQARCFTRGDRVRLVVVMRGKRPEPNAAQARELSNLMLAAAPASLAAKDALRIDPPRVRKLRVRVLLRVSSLDKAGELSDEVKGRLEKLFDTASGGMDGTGWPLGATPSAEDVAFALLDTPELIGLATVEFLEVAAEGEREWSGKVKPHELVQLDDDPVRFGFEIFEEIA